MRQTRYKRQPLPGIRIIGSITAAAVSVALACVGPAYPGMAAPADEPAVPYRASLKGLWFGARRNAVADQSLAMTLEEHPPATLRQLENRVEGDVEPMTAVLKAQGYLDASVEPEIRTNRSPVRVIFRVNKGPRYTVSAFRVVYTNGAERVPVAPPDILKPGSPATVEAVEAAEDSVLRFLQERGFPHPKKKDRIVSRDEARHTVEVVCPVDPGPPATLGAAEIEGCTRVDPGYVRRRVRWAPGDAYDVRILEDLEKDLLRSGLFASARVALPAGADAAGRIPVRIIVAERPRRTVRAGVSYHSDKGAGGEVSWENRNWLGEAESLSFALFASEVDYGARSRFTRPDVMAPDVDLHLELDVRQENLDAYQSRKGRLALLLEDRIGKIVTVTGGLAYELDQVEQQGESTRLGLVSVPLSIALDWRDDKLDPSRGATLTLATTPYEDVFSDLMFLKSLGEGSVFLPLWKSPRTGLALRAMLGSITGAAGEDVPADKRFYAGGGGTIRGYKYQSVGELEDGEPVGGCSLAAVSAEWRARISTDLGAAVFADGGTAYPGSSPDSEMPFRWGAGVGVRYYLGFAPLRMDVAIPLDRRKEVDAAYQFYISLGQAF